MTNTPVNGHAGIEQQTQERRLWLPQGPQDAAGQKPKGGPAYTAGNRWLTALGLVPALLQRPGRRPLSGSIAAGGRGSCSPAAPTHSAAAQPAPAQPAATQSIGGRVCIWRSSNSIASHSHHHANIGRRGAPGAREDVAARGWTTSATRNTAAAISRSCSSSCWPMHACMHAWNDRALCACGRRMVQPALRSSWAPRRAASRTAAPHC